MSFITNGFLYHEFCLLSVGGRQTSNHQFWEIVVVEVNEFVVGEIFDIVFVVIYLIERSDALGGVGGIIAEE